MIIAEDILFKLQQVYIARQTLSRKAGMEEFIGRWQVRLYLDGEFIIQQAFIVAC